MAAGYAKLLEPKEGGFSYLMADGSVTLGRRTKKPEGNIVPLSPLKNISRRHLAIYYKAESKAWMVRCLGKNGIRVSVGASKANMVFLQPAQEMEIVSGTRIEIGEFWFYFLLPVGSPAIDHPIVVPPSAQPAPPPAASSSGVAPLTLDKPSFSHIVLLFKALSTFSDHKAHFSEILSRINELFPYYRDNAAPSFSTGLRKVLNNNPAYIRDGTGKRDPVFSLDPQYTEETLPPTSSKPRAKKDSKKGAEESAKEEDEGDE